MRVFDDFQGKTQSAKGVVTKKSTKKAKAPKAASRTIKTKAQVVSGDVESSIHVANTKKATATVKKAKETKASIKRRNLVKA